jgi:riboflavin biosynthesis pyrimidine reductase
LRSLLPEPSERVDLVEAYSRGIEVPSGRPFVRVSMVSSLDGAVAFGGRSGVLGGPADKLVFSVLRSLADVVLVGAGTARTERYGPANLPREVQEMRSERGQSALPRIAVVTQSANLDWGSSLFAESGARPLVIAPGTADAARLREAAAVADVLAAGAGPVDLLAAVRELGAQGARHVVCEGGPSLNASLVAAHLVDELCLTLSPKLAGSVGGGLSGGWLGSAGPLLARASTGEPELAPGQPPERLLELDLAHLLEEDGFLFLRLRARPGP